MQWIPAVDTWHNTDLVLVCFMQSSSELLEPISDLTPGCVSSHLFVFCYLFVWFGCVLDRAKGLSLILKFVI